MMYLILAWLWWPLCQWWTQRRRATPPQKILLLQTAKIGDMVCTLPLIGALAEAGKDITVWHAAMNTPLLQHDPRIQQRQIRSPAEWQGWRGKWQLVRALRQQHFDVVILASPNLPWLVICVWAMIPWRLAITPDRPSRSMRWASGLLTHRLTHQVGTLLLDEWAQLLRAIGCRVQPPQRHLYPAPNAASLLPPVLQLAPNVPHIALGISAANKLKELGAPFLLQLIPALQQQYHAHIVLIGSAADQPLAQQLLQQLPSSAGVIDSTGMVGLDVLPALLQQCRVYVGVDSGITYLADALAVPVVSIVGPTDPREQRPLGPKARFVIERPACYPCAFVHHTPHRCHTGSLACIRQVTVEKVVVTVGEVWS